MQEVTPTVGVINRAVKHPDTPPGTPSGAPDGDVAIGCGQRRGG